MRELPWRKVNGEAIWHGKPSRLHRLPPLRLEVVAGIRQSSVMNRNAVVKVQLPLSARKYETVCQQEFYTTWHAKKVVDALLCILRVKNNDDHQKNYEWLLNELNSLVTPDVEPPSKHDWATVAGYPY